jgi:diguanylate cyclase (GGDEF)-like protein/PAS domain S-box-containing protein
MDVPVGHTGAAAPAVLAPQFGDDAGAVAERDRLAVLRRFGVLDTPPEEAFEDLTALAARLCGTPMALVSLVDEHRQWFKARLGIALCQTSREESFCAHALHSTQVLLVPDATADPRFAGNPLVTGEPHLRFYAGAPLVSAGGHVLGTLCVLDVVARTLTDEQLADLARLARQVVSQLELRRQAAELAVEVAARADAQAQLRDSQRLLQGVLEHTDVVVYAKDLDGRFLLANPALGRLLGRDVEQVLGRSDYDLFPAVAADDYRRHDQHVAASGRRASFAEQTPHPDGTVHGYLSTRFPLTDDTGQVYAVAGVSTDVTELVAARAAHAEAEQRWQALVEHSPVAVAVIDDTGRFAYANPGALALYGAQPGQLDGRAAAQLVPPGDDGQAAALFGALLAGGPPVLARRWTLRRLDGTTTAVEINAAAVSYLGRAAVQVELRDISAQVAAETALRASEARFRGLFACSPVGAAESLPDGTFLAVNPQLCTMLGYTAAELIGQLPSVLLADPADLPTQRRDLAGLQHSSGYLVERTYRRKDGSTLPVLVGIGVVRDPAGAVHRVLGTVVDISERVAARQALQSAHTALAAAHTELAAAHAEVEARQAFTDAVLDSIDVGIVACDADGRLTLFNDTSRRWHGMDPADRPGDAVDPSRFATAFDLHDAHGAPLSTGQIPLLRALTDGQVNDAEIVISPHGLPATRVLCTGRTLATPDGRPAGAVVAMTDITAARAAQAALREHAAFHDAVLAASPDLIFVSDPARGQVLWSSHNLPDDLGHTRQQVRELGGDRLAQTVHPDDTAGLQAADTASRDLENGQALQSRYRVRDSSGDWRWLSRRVTPFLRDSAGQVTQVLAVARDITDVVEVEQRLNHAALHDRLTGLPNRTLLSDRLSLALRRSTRTGTDVTVLFCDLDGFKHVNDTAGHAAGDIVLTVTADRLRAVLRPQDTVARVGGDEFVIILEAGEHAMNSQPGQVADTDAVLVAERIQTALIAPVCIGEAEHVVSVSIGMTVARSGDDPDQVLRDADAAMYLAKTRGKARYETFQSLPRTQNSPMTVDDRDGRQ